MRKNQKINFLLILGSIATLGAAKPIKETPTHSLRPQKQTHIPLCIKMTPNKICSYCWGGFPTKDPNNHDCTPFQSTSNCQAAVSTSNTQSCYWCREGYYRAKTGKCLKLTPPIPDCTFAYQSFNKIVCNSCRGGVPSVDGSRCIPFYNLDKPVKFCLEGTRVTESGGVGCSICELGYAARPQEGSEECVDVKGNEGCWIEEGGKCAGCRAWMGYEAVGYDVNEGDVCAKIR